MNARPSIRPFLGGASGVDEEARCLFSYYLKIPHRIRLCAVTVYQNNLVSTSPDFLKSSGFLPVPSYKLQVYSEDD